MRQGVTLVRLHGSEHLTVHTEPSVPFTEQIDFFRKMRAVRFHPEYAELQLWVSCGDRKKHRMSPPKQDEPEAPPADEAPDESGQVSETLTQPENPEVLAPAPAKKMRVKWSGAKSGST